MPIHNTHVSWLYPAYHTEWFFYYVANKTCNNAGNAYVRV